MSTSCWIGTRKGLIKASLDAADKWSLSPAIFPGEPVTAVLSTTSLEAEAESEPARSTAVYAALNLGHFGPKLHRSRDNGVNWQECTAPAFPKQAKDEATAKSVELVWVLEQGRDNELWAGTVPAGLFRSTDEGESWEHMAALTDLEACSEWFGGGFDEPGVHSISVDPRDRQKLTVAISCGGVWFSDDAGISWRAKAKGMRAEYVPPVEASNPNIQDPHRLIACESDPDRLWVQHHNGIFRYDESDSEWTEITNVTPSAFGFALAVHPQDPDTAWFVPAVKDECRVPVDNQLVVNRTRDGGLSFDSLRHGLPQAHSYDLIYRHCLEVDDQGKVLVMGSTSGNLWTSLDSGDSWQTLTNNLADIYCVRFGHL